MLINIHEAKTRFSDLIRRVERGEDVVIGRAGVPVAKLVPYASPGGSRVPGLWRGQVEIADDFDDLPEDFERIVTA